MRGVLVLLACTGCSSILGIEDFKLGDAGGGNEMNETGYCLGPMRFRMCVEAKPTNVESIADFSLNTEANPKCAPSQPKSWKDQGQPDACIIVASSITLSGSMVAAVGSRPLVIFASDTITINTQLDVASHLMSQTNNSEAAASDFDQCPRPTGSGGTATGGGAGGSFMKKGGNGGRSSTNVAGTSAAAADMNPPTILRGGCPGAPGQTNQQNLLGGLGGFGGGAVYLVAGTKITIMGSINASGARGLGGDTAAGGGGGGSGGMILLHAPVIEGNGGVLIANGGGGGGGGGSNLGGMGGEPTPQIPSQPAAGGTGTGGGGNGGFGFAGPNNAADGSIGAAGGPAAGGGGGGGGGGYIRVNVAPSMVTASPSVSIVPDP